jgi:hypothetical protein
VLIVPITVVRVRAEGGDVHMAGKKKKAAKKKAATKKKK